MNLHLIFWKFLNSWSFHKFWYLFSITLFILQNLPVSLSTNCNVFGKGKPLILFPFFNENMLAMCQYKHAVYVSFCCCLYACWSVSNFFTIARMYYSYSYLAKAYVRYSWILHGFFLLVCFWRSYTLTWRVNAVSWISTDTVCLDSFCVFCRIWYFLVPLVWTMTRQRWNLGSTWVENFVHD